MRALDIIRMTQLREFWDFMFAPESLFCDKDVYVAPSGIASEFTEEDDIPCFICVFWEYGNYCSQPEIVHFKTEEDANRFLEYILDNYPYLYNEGYVESGTKYEHELPIHYYV